MNRDKNIKDREQALKEFILRFKQENVSYEEFQSYLEEVYKPEHEPGIGRIGKKPKELIIPVSIFDNGMLSSLESIVKYLRENKGLRLSEIARLLGRDQRAIGVTYRFARKKLGQELSAPATKQSLPVKVIADRKLSVLESIVHHLKKTYGLQFHEIALMLRRDDRTVWTVYQRALKKLHKTN